MSKNFKLVNKTKYTDYNLFNILIDDDYRNIKIDIILNNKKMEKDIKIKTNTFIVLDIYNNVPTIDLSKVIGFGKSGFINEKGIFVKLKTINSDYDKLFNLYNDVYIYEVGESFLLSF